MIKWQIVWAYRGHPDLRKYLDQGWEPFAVDSEWVVLRKSEEA